MNVHDAYVKMLNTVVPDLKPWLEDRIARGQSAYQILAEFRTALAGGAASLLGGDDERDEVRGPMPRTVALMTERAHATLADYPDAALLDELHARLTRHVAASRAEDGWTRPAEGGVDLTDEAP
jgi:hypothetical protein